MSEEEQEAIKNVEKFVYSILNGIGANDCKILLNYINKLQKEIDQLKETMGKQYVSKKIIRDKIDDLIGEQGTGNLAQYIAIGEKLQALREILGE